LSQTSNAHVCINFQDCQCQFAPLNNWETLDAFSAILTLADFRLSASPQNQPTRFVVPSGDSSHGGWLEVPLWLKAKVRERNHD